MRPGGIKQRDVAPVQTFAKAAAKCSNEVSTILPAVVVTAYQHRRLVPTVELIKLLPSTTAYSLCPSSGSRLWCVRDGQLRKHRAQHVSEGVHRLQSLRSTKGKFFFGFVLVGLQPSLLAQAQQAGVYIEELVADSFSSRLTS